MRRLAIVALVLPLLAGCFSSSPVANEGGGPSRSVPRWVADEKLPANALPGAKLFAVAGCTACHTYDGSGSANLGAPDLTAIGIRHRGIALEIQHLKDPASISPGSPMPRFASLGRERLGQLAIFLEASKGT
jgi:mono/diheme cytochrome c family protein